MSVLLLRRRYLVLVCCALVSAIATAEPPTFSLAMRDGAFEPAKLTVPAGEKIKLNITNSGSAPAEFESYDLNREKVIVGHSQATLYIGPLASGSYEFFNDFDRQAKGRIVAQ